MTKRLVLSFVATKSPHPHLRSLSMDNHPPGPSPVPDSSPWTNRVLLLTQSEKTNCENVLLSPSYRRSIRNNTYHRSNCVNTLLQKTKRSRENV